MKFSKGETVVLTRAGKKAFPKSELLGTVMSDERDFIDIITVRVDGRRTAERFHSSFWRRLRKGERPITRL